MTSGFQNRAAVLVVGSWDAKGDVVWAAFVVVRGEERERQWEKNGEESDKRGRGRKAKVKGRETASTKGRKR